MTAKIYTSFKEFYPYYLKEHSNKTNRVLHFIGTLLVIFIVVFSIISHQYRWMIAMPFAGYGFAWLGHFVFEKNKPATFKYPLWSLTGDFLMFYHILTGQIGKKMNEK